MHLRLAFSSSQVNNYTITDLSEIEQIMDSFGARSLNDLINRKMRIRRYELPVGSLSSLG